MINLKKFFLIAGLVFLAAGALFVPIPEYHQKASCSLPPNGGYVDSSCRQEGWYLGPSLLIRTLSLLGTKQSVNQIETPRNKYICKVNADCTLGINLKSCCGCPEAVSREFIDGENWKVYNEKEDYYSQVVEKAASCRNVACQPCPPLLNPICSYNVCQFNIGGTD